MFSDDMLEKILLSEEIRKVPIGAQSTVIHVCERVLEEFGYDFCNRRNGNSNNQESDYR